MLDLAVWVTETPDSSKIYGMKQIVHHAFYEKECP